jgi:hypothetical protein
MTGLLFCEVSEAGRLVAQMIEKRSDRVVEVKVEKSEGSIGGRCEELMV